MVVPLKNAQPGFYCILKNRYSTEQFSATVDLRGYIYILSSKRRKNILWRQRKGEEFGPVTKFHYDVSHSPRRKKATYGFLASHVFWVFEFGEHLNLLSSSLSLIFLWRKGNVASSALKYITIQGRYNCYKCYKFIFYECALCNSYFSLLVLRFKGA